MKPKVLITGITGLLGHNTAEYFIARNYEVWAYVRRDPKIKISKVKYLVQPSETAILNLLRKCQALIHIAAETRQDVLNIQDYLAVNVEWTKQWTNWVNTSQCPQMVFISSANTCGFSNEPGNENTSTVYPFSASYYTQSKLLAEESLKSYASKVCIIKPSFMIGPNDHKPSSGKLILMALNKKLIFYPSGGKNFVYVNDVAELIYKTVALKITNDTFLAVGENLSYQQFYQKVLLLNHQKSLLIPIPNCVLNILGKLGDTFIKMGIRTSVSTTNMKILQSKNYYDGSKSEQILNRPYTPIEQGIQEAIRYFNSKK